MGKRAGSAARSRTGNWKKGRVFLVSLSLSCCASCYRPICQPSRPKRSSVLAQKKIRPASHPGSPRERRSPGWVERTVSAQKKIHPASHPVSLERGARRAGGRKNHVGKEDPSRPISQRTGPYVGQGKTGWLCPGMLCKRGNDCRKEHEMWPL